MDITIQEKLENFLKQYKTRKYGKSEILIRGDENPSGLFYLKSGIVKKYVISQKGEELIVDVYKPTYVFPMSWAINDFPNYYYYEALTDIEVWFAPKSEIITFIKNDKDLLFVFLSRIYKSVDDFLWRMTYLMGGSAYERLITEIIIQTKKFGIKKENGLYELKTTEKELAGETGMTRETVSRELKILKDKKLVSLEKKTLKIRSLDELEKEL